MTTHLSYIFRQAFADVRHRYAGTGLGWVWNVAHPLATITIYSVVFTTVFPQSTGKHWDYTLYLCSGFFPWVAFSDSVYRGSTSIVEGANYLKKLPIPETVFPARAAAAAMIGLGINFSLLAVVAIFTGVRPAAVWLLLPLPLLALSVLGFGFGLFLATLNVFFRDVGQAVSVVLQLVFWTVPIAYHLPNTPRWWLAFHPLLPPIRAVHDLFLDKTLPTAETWSLLSLWPVAVTAVAFVVVRKLSPEIRDVV